MSYPWQLHLSTSTVLIGSLSANARKNWLESKCNILRCHREKRFFGNSKTVYFACLVANVPKSYINVQQGLFARVSSQAKQLYDKRKSVPSSLSSQFRSSFRKIFFCTVTGNPTSQKRHNVLACMPNYESGHKSYPSLLNWNIPIPATTYLKKRVSEVSAQHCSSHPSGQRNQALN